MRRVPNHLMSLFVWPLAVAGAGGGAADLVRATTGAWLLTRDHPATSGAQQVATSTPPATGSPGHGIDPRRALRLSVAAACEILPDAALPPSHPGRIGGLSGNVFNPITEQWLAVTDDQDLPRWYPLVLSVEDGRCQARAGPAVPIVDNDAAATRLEDLEGIALLPNSDVLLAMEGASDHPGGPSPGVVEVDAQGRRKRALPVPSHYLGGPHSGRGLRDNGAFESLTVTPAGTTVFTAAEEPLVQDDERPSFARGAVSRLLQYAVQADGSFAIAREYALPLVAIPHPGNLEPVRANSGVVDLLALDDRTLLMLERAYTRGADGRGRNDITLSRAVLDGAEDVSRLDSLRGFRGVPVRKETLLELGSLTGSLPAWLQHLDNFEGMAFGPRLADGRPSLVLVSDDNFNASQHTAFIVLAIDVR
jgi:3-phytase